MSSLRQTLIQCQVYDLGYEGAKFTWENGKDDLTRDRLDSAVATNSWKGKFPMAKVQVLQSTAFDHLPLFLSLRVSLQRFIAKRFWYENSWALEVDCKQIVESSWKNLDVMTLENRIANCTQFLQEWAQNHP